MMCKIAVQDNGILVLRLEKVVTDSMVSVSEALSDNTAK
jgi:hypothetical protein